MFSSSGQIEDEKRRMGFRRGNSPRKVGVEMLEVLLIPPKIGSPFRQTYIERKGETI